MNIRARTAVVMAIWAGLCAQALAQEVSHESPGKGEREEREKRREGDDDDEKDEGEEKGVARQKKKKKKKSKFNSYA